MPLKFILTIFFIIIYNYIKLKSATVRLNNIFYILSKINILAILCQKSDYYIFINDCFVDSIIKKKAV